MLQEGCHIEKVHEVMYILSNKLFLLAKGLSFRVVTSLACLWIISTKLLNHMTS